MHPPHPAHTHLSFHLDHCAAVPYLTEKTPYTGPVYMTHPTMAVFKLLLTDYLRVASKDRRRDLSQRSASGRDQGQGQGQDGYHHELYSQEDVINSLKRITPVHFHQVISVPGTPIKFQANCAGHVLGAATFLVDMGGAKVLYTGDFSCEDDRHMPAAEVPRGLSRGDVDALLVESTYGTQNHVPRVEREAGFISAVTRVVEAGGKCLLPIFALGRAQELLLILEDHWRTHPHLHSVPIFYTSPLASKCLGVYRAFLGHMNENIVRLFERQDRNPFSFRFIREVGSASTVLAQVRPGQPCVVLASPGMLQSGASRQLFEEWCQGAKNGVVMTGYSVDGTLAKAIVQTPHMTIQTAAGPMVNVRSSVDVVSFSAHSDFARTSAFIDRVGPRNVILIHGERHTAHALATSLREHLSSEQARRRDRGEPADDWEATVSTPGNCQTVVVPVQPRIRVELVGRLAGEEFAPPSSSTPRSALPDARSSRGATSGSSAPQSTGAETEAATGPPFRAVVYDDGIDEPRVIHPDELEDFSPDLHQVSVETATVFPIALPSRHDIDTAAATAAASATVSQVQQASPTFSPAALTPVFNQLLHLLVDFALSGAIPDKYLRPALAAAAAAVAPIADVLATATATGTATSVPTLSPVPRPVLLFLLRTAIASVFAVANRAALLAAPPRPINLSDPTAGLVNAEGAPNISPKLVWAQKQDADIFSKINAAAVTARRAAMRIPEPPSGSAALSDRLGDSACPKTEVAATTARQVGVKAEAPGAGPTPRPARAAGTLAPAAAARLRRQWTLALMGSENCPNDAPECVDRVPDPSGLLLPGSLIVTVAGDGADADDAVDDAPWPWLLVGDVKVSVEVVPTPSTPTATPQADPRFTLNATVVHSASPTNDAVADTVYIALEELRKALAVTFALPDSVPDSPR
jgi:Cft2 family RNA processing exonuclease